MRTGIGWIGTVKFIEQSGDSPLFPSNTIPPHVSGDPYVGEVLTATPGAWTGADSVAGEWYVNSVATGDTDTGYTVLLADAGLLIEYRETATNTDGSVQVVASVTASVNELFMVTDNGSEPFAVAEGNFLVRAA